MTGPALHELPMVGFTKRWFIDATDDSGQYFRRDCSVSDLHGMTMGKHAANEIAYFLETQTKMLLKEMELAARKRREDLFDIITNFDPWHAQDKFLKFTRLPDPEPMAMPTTLPDPVPLGELISDLQSAGRERIREFVK